MLVVRCTYSPPRIGDVALISCVWHDDALDVYTPHAMYVPVVGGVLWWQWAQDEPVEILRALYAVYEDGIAQGDDTYAS